MSECVEELLTKKLSAQFGMLAMREFPFSNSRTFFNLRESPFLCRISFIRGIDFIVLHKVIIVDC